MGDVPIFKVVVAGDGAVGKTSLIRQFCERKFEASRVETIGVDFQTQTVDLNTGRVKLSIWDMAGQDRFQFMRAGFYRGSRSAAIVYDLTSPDSFSNLVRWRAEILQAVHSQPFIVVGNKLDLPRAIDRLAGERLAMDIGARYLETSAKTGEGVDEFFNSLATLARDFV
jgi:small GTP-binding protein